ncbi:MAG TPA: hypothetical protein VJ377_00575 [Dehalococcoidales bacterium]|nr:hypothetical protein [Dehalococcoidales bacterium]
MSRRFKVVLEPNEPGGYSKSQAYFWTKEWQEAEKEASEDIKAGRIKEFDTVEELLEDLEGR